MFEVFNQIKGIKNSPQQNKSKNFEKILFQINTKLEKPYLVIVDEKTKTEIVPDHKYFTGATRNLIKAFNNVHQNKAFNFNWVEDNNFVYLADHPFLIEYLKNCDLLVNEQYQKIDFVHNKAEITLNLIEKKENIVSKFSVLTEELDFDLEKSFFINEEYLLVENKIYNIDPLGEKYTFLKLCESTFPKTYLEKYLSILYSNFENIAIKYQEYSVVYDAPKKSKPALFFEKIDEDNSLYLRVSETYDFLEPEFLETYDITRIAFLNVLEKRILISELERHVISDFISEITKVLNKIKKSLDKNNKYEVEDNLFILEEEIAKHFIQKELTSFFDRFIIFGAEKLKAYNFRTVTPRLQINNLNHGINFFEGAFNLEIEDQLVSLFDALAFYKKNSYIKLNDGTNAIINKSYIEKLERILKKSKNNVKFSFFDLPIVEELIDQKIYQENFKPYKEVFLGFNKLNEKTVKIPKIETTLRNYQIQGYKWLKYLNETSLGGCLADEMGLGKTVQTIALLSSIYPKEQKPTLIVMPKSLLFNWENELKKLNPKISYYIYYADRNLEEAKNANLILTTYGILRSQIETLKDEAFYYVILDESQNIKNITSQTTKAVMLLNSEHRLALSGTPVENNLGELYSLFRFLNPAMFGSIDDFNKSYGTPIQKDNNKEAINELRKKIYPFILRRLKKEVLKELPPKIEQILYVEMTPEQKHIYEQKRNYYYNNLKNKINEEGINKSQFIILQAINELRQIATIPEIKSGEEIKSSKREVLIEHIEEIVSSGHKVLLFTNFLSVINYLSQDLNEIGIEHLVMTGATKDRQELVDKFQNNPKYKVFIMTLKTGGVGLNLTKADYVFIYDPWWNKSAENQAIDRTHRIGQDKTVFSYKLITKGTIEEKILQLQQHKTQLFENIINSDDASIKSLTEDDIDFIFEQ